jgi:hypothetical protein
VTGIKFHNQDLQVLGDLVPGNGASVCYSVCYIPNNAPVCYSVCYIPNSAPVYYSVCYIPNRVILLTLPVGLAVSKDFTIGGFRFYDFSLTLISDHNLDSYNTINDKSTWIVN